MRGRRIWTALVIVGALLAGALVLILYAYRRDLTAAQARLASSSQIVSTPCGLIEYSDAGKGPPVLVIHGLGGGFDQGLDVGRGVLGDGFRVIAPSRFGYLRTPLPADGSAEAQADAHACLLDALNLPPVPVLGFSAGASSTMQLCLRHPHRCPSMILLVPAIFAPHPPSDGPLQPSIFVQFVRRVLGSNFGWWAATKVARDSLVEAILATPLVDFRSASAEEQERLLLFLRHALPVRPRAKGISNDSVVLRSLPRYDLERFTVPTLVIGAENDLFGLFEGARYTAEHIRGARLLAYPNGGHLLVGHEKEVRADVHEFLNP
jgi:pimeloyl-ACP methyl ester carboxylesterase